VPRLVVFRGDAVESEIRLTGSPVRLGRHARNDVVLDDSLNGVSRFHAEIRPEGSSYVIVDLNSRNGVWINGRRIKDKATLSLGVPATVGAFELALEDDASGTFDGRPAYPKTIVSSAAVSDTVRPSGRPPAPARQGPAFSPKTRQILLWSGASAAVLLICLVTFFVVRGRSRQAQVAVVQPPVAAPVVPVEQPPPPPPEDPNKALNDQDLTAAREQMAAKDYAGAVRDHLQPILERDPENAAALEMKKQAEDTIALEAASKVAKKAPPKPEAPAEPETPGIGRKAGEGYAEYTARVRQVQSNLAEGKTALDKQEFPVALARFRLVDRDAPKFQGVDALIADTLAKQQKAVDVAIDSGQQNETANKILEARRWYDIALQRDPTSVVAREKRAAVVLKMNAAAEALYNQATYAQKSGNAAKAADLFKQIIDSTMPGDEFREKATKQMEALKR
jgi:hypothetical protein